MKNQCLVYFSCFIFAGAICTNSFLYSAEKSKKMEFSKGFFPTMDISEEELFRTVDNMDNPVVKEKVGQIFIASPTLAQVSELVNREFKNKWNVRVAFIDNPNIGIDITLNVYSQLVKGLKRSSDLDIVSQKLKSQMRSSNAVVMLAKGSNKKKLVKDGKVKVGEQWLEPDVYLEQKNTYFMIDEIVRIVKDAKEVSRAAMASGAPSN